MGVGVAWSLWVRYSATVLGFHFNAHFMLNGGPTCATLYDSRLTTLAII
jgi:hypothetical protein